MMDLLYGSIAHIKVSSDTDYTISINFSVIPASERLILCDDVHLRQTCQQITTNGYRGVISVLRSDIIADTYLT